MWSGGGAGRLPPDARLPALPAIPPGNAKKTGGASSAALPQYRDDPRAAAQRRRRAHAAERGRSLVVPVDARRVPRHPALRGPAPPHRRLARHAHGTPQCAGRAGHALSQPLWQCAEPARVSADRKRPRFLSRRAVHLGLGKPLGRRVRPAAAARPHQVRQVAESRAGLRSLRSPGLPARRALRAGARRHALQQSAWGDAPAREPAGRRRRWRRHDDVPFRRHGRRSLDCAAGRRRFFSACAATTTSTRRSASRPTSLPTGCAACCRRA